jgi:hypothetical protein
MKPTIEERFWSKVDKDGPVPVGHEELGTCWIWTGFTRNGYGLFWYQGQDRQAQRICYILSFGDIPKRMVIDHICHDRACVNPEHIRLATVSQNNKNLSRAKNNTSGFKGVRWHKGNKNWQSQIQSDGIRTHLGSFDTPEEAYAAYCEAASRLHGEFVNLG